MKLHTLKIFAGKRSLKIEETGWAADFRGGNRNGPIIGWRTLYRVRDTARRDVDPNGLIVVDKIESPELESHIRAYVGEV